MSPATKYKRISTLLSTTVSSATKLAFLGPAKYNSIVCYQTVPTAYMSHDASCVRKAGIDRLSERTNGPRAQMFHTTFYFINNKYISLFIYNTLVSYFHIVIFYVE